MTLFPVCKHAAETWSINASRRLSSSIFARTDIIPADLQFDQLIPANQNTPSGPLVVLHGLFGSKRNWLSLSKAFLRELNRPIYTLDLRNHGSSPHVHPMTYNAMASDVLHFCKTRSLSDISIIGHSMGGKVAMALALDPHLPPGLLSRLIVVDMTPSKGNLSPEFRGYIEGMKKVEASQVSTKKEAHEILTLYERDSTIRDFLLTNLVPASADHPHTTFRVPLDILSDAIPELGTFPYEPGEQVWPGKTLLLKGSKSKYVNRHTIPLMKTFFPDMRLEILETGHWIHAESPHEFKRLVADFIRS